MTTAELAIALLPPVDQQNISLARVMLRKQALSLIGAGVSLAQVEMALLAEAEEFEAGRVKREAEAAGTARQ